MPQPAGPQDADTFDLGSDSERARLNVTRAIRTAISRIRDRAPDAAAHLDQAVRTGTRCSYSPPNRPG